MRLIALLQLPLVLSLAAVAQGDSAARFNKFLSKSLSTAPLKLDDATFTDITSSPRDYTAVVLLTAMPAQFGCHLCKDFQPEYDILGKSWVNGDRKGESRVLFGTLDFPDGKGTFQKV